MKRRIVRIGNSRGIRIPKVLLEQTGLGEEVELEVDGDRLVIRPAGGGRDGWEQAFAAMADAGDDALIDSDSGTAEPWDQEEWEW